MNRGRELAPEPLSTHVPFAISNAPNCHSRAGWGRLDLRHARDEAPQWQGRRGSGAPPAHVTLPFLFARNPHAFESRRVAGEHR